MRGLGNKKGMRVWWSVVGIVILMVVLAALLGIGGCGDSQESALYVPTTTAGAMQTAAAPAAVSREGEEYDALSYDKEYNAEQGYTGGADTAGTGSLAGLKGTAGQKIISDAQLEIEVESGKFEAVFDQALLLADRYSGYVVSSGSYAGKSGETDGMKSGTIALRIPAASFTRALADAAKLGEVKHRQVQTQDVTEEYVDLQARMANSEAHVQALLALLAKAKTVDEILQVRQYLTVAQQELEQLKGRLRYLDEHTDYSTVTLTLYESGEEVVASTEWGFTAALKDAVRNLVKAVNTIVRGLGVLVPVLVVLAIVGGIIYVVWSRIARRRREGDRRRYQPYPQDGEGHAAAGREVAPAPMAQTSGASSAVSAEVEAPPAEAESTSKDG